MAKYSQNKMAGLEVGPGDRLGSRIAVKTNNAEVMIQGQKKVE